ncbi:hypothetical protein PENANT_c014G10322, partial [Penicillium antarcticum]
MGVSKINGTAAGEVQVHSLNGLRLSIGFWAGFSNPVLGPGQDFWPGAGFGPLTWVIVRPRRVSGLVRLAQLPGGEQYYTATIPEAPLVPQ